MTAVTGTQESGGPLGSKSGEPSLSEIRRGYLKGIPRSLRTQIEQALARGESDLWIVENCAVTPDQLAAVKRYQWLLLNT